MSGRVECLPQKKDRFLSAGELSEAIAATDFTNCSATVVGYGDMGRAYLFALEALGVKRIRVVSRSAVPLQELVHRPEIQKIAGGFQHFSASIDPEELGIVAVPIPFLMPAVRHLLALGFRKILVEKPISLWSREIEILDEELRRKEVFGVCAYNRVAYPSFLECRSRAAQEGGPTSCIYTFTEIISSDWPQRFSEEELARWGISNSLHPIGMAHRLIGLPKELSGSRRGYVRWHPSGTVFVGSGISDQGVPFSYHADWGSAGRWGVELHTSSSSYRLCPLEKLFRKVEPKGEWVELPLATFAPHIKAGCAEEVAAMLAPSIREMIPLYTLTEAAALTRCAEEIFGYER